MALSTGRVVQVQGAVVDVEFASGAMPEIYHSVEVPREGMEPLTLEVQRHMGGGVVRTVAMDTTDGLGRGLPAVATGAAIKVPVGESSLGRGFNVLGKPLVAQCGARP